MLSPTTPSFCCMERERERDFIIIILHQHTWYAAPGSEESILLANPQDQTLCRNVNPIWVIEKKKVFKETYLNRFES
jgi:hypothetical protein